jgi:hypothetical protein
MPKKKYRKPLVRLSIFHLIPLRHHHPPDIYTCPIIARKADVQEGMT